MQLATQYIAFVKVDSVMAWLSTMKTFYPSHASRALPLPASQPCHLAYITSTNNPIPVALWSIVIGTYGTRGTKCALEEGIIRDFQMSWEQNITDDCGQWSTLHQNKLYVWTLFFALQRLPPEMTDASTFTHYPSKHGHNSKTIIKVLLCIQGSQVAWRADLSLILPICGSLCFDK